MFKLSAVILLASVVYYTQCVPTVSQANTQTESGNKLQLYVNNGSDAISYHLSSVLTDLESEDQQIDAELNALLPFLSFLFGAASEGGFDDCFDQMEIQLIQAES